MRREAPQVLTRVVMVAALAALVAIPAGCGLEFGADRTPPSANDNSNGDIPPGQNVPDSDADGVADDIDTCPDTPEGEQVDEVGCALSQVDTDSDGVPDNSDQCPDTSAGVEVDQVGCPAGDTVGDSDGDGISDLVDACPDTPDGAEVNARGCADSQLDSDGDGIPNDLDECPDTPGRVGVNAAGCPRDHTDGSDDDGDGVPDEDDQCPDTTPGTDVDAEGCAADERDSDQDGVTDDLDRCPGTAAGANVDDDGCPVADIPSAPGGGGGGVGGGTPACYGPEDCGDADACTEDRCVDGDCEYVPIADCLSCSVAVECPPVDVVFVMDTSGSMVDEAAALCAGIADIVEVLSQLGVDVNPTFLGITEAPTGVFACLATDVVTLLPGPVPGDPESCPFPDTLSAYESWGPASAIVAERFAWSDGAIRVIVPLSDEGPCDGSFPDGCNDPGDDRDSITNAIAVATDHGVIVSPITGTSSDDCVLTLAADLAAGTGGVTFQSVEPQADLAGLIHDLVLSACEPDANCDDQNVCTDDDTCEGGVCAGTAIPGCVLCSTDTDCDDGLYCSGIETCEGGSCATGNGPCSDDELCDEENDRCVECFTNDTCDDENACTDDICDDGDCVNSLNYDDLVSCCDPADGSLSVIDDDDACTEDICAPATGMVSHDPAEEGTPCDDGLDCTVNDQCDGESSAAECGCRGDDVNGMDCSETSCPGPDSVCEANECSCTDDPELCIEPVSGVLPDSGCFDVSEEISFDVTLGLGTALVTGGQFLVDYDPSVLEFVRVDLAPPFTQLITLDVDEIRGRVFFAVLALGIVPEQCGPRVMATLRFRPVGSCATDEVCFIEENPKGTILTSAQGGRVPFIPCCSGEVSIRDGLPQLDCPESLSVNADPGRLSAWIEWEPVTATGGCGEVIEPECRANNGSGVSIDDLIGGGGQIPTGLSEFECVATNECGGETECAWSIDVSPTNLVEVDLELSPPMGSGPLNRCISFEFFSSCIQSPVVVEKMIRFGLPLDVPGRARNIVFDIPAGHYMCATARDPLHTLASVTMLESDGSKYMARFADDPLLGGNWLVGGNLNGDQVIDARDVALLNSQLSSIVDPDTECGLSVPHADLNGDGVVDEFDAIILEYSFLVQEDTCCPTSTRALGLSPMKEIPVDRLSAMGLGGLRAADLNRDEVINLADLDVVISRGSLGFCTKQRDRSR